MEAAEGRPLSSSGTGTDGGHQCLEVPLCRPHCGHSRSTGQAEGGGGDTRPQTLIQWPDARSNSAPATTDAPLLLVGPKCPTIWVTGAKCPTIWVIGAKCPTSWVTGAKCPRSGRSDPKH
ncbi:hypothetical protein ACOMHN_046134 [Nucella lapillus]